MEKVVMPLAAQHLEEAAGVLGQAFLDDPAFVELFKGVDVNERQRRMTGFFSACASACLRTGWPLAVRDQDHTLAAATVYPPGSYPQPSPEQLAMFAKSLWHAGLLKPITWAIMKRSVDMLGEMSKEHPKRVHYYLEYIGVTPDHQSHGIGSHMIQALLQKADQEQVGCYLETAAPGAVPLYQRLGFRTVTERAILGVPMWFMWRDPEPAATPPVSP